MDIVKPRRALISVSDKRGVVELARMLTEYGTRILSTGGTAQLLSDNGVDAVSVSDYTGFPELMGGRLKTLHPKIHGGILGRPDVDGAQMREHGIRSIDLVVVNLYPFAEVAADPASSISSIIENIDIGGPAMIRATAKNSAHACVIVDPDDYPVIVEELDEFDGIRLETRTRLAQKAYACTSAYDATIADYLYRQNQPDNSFPPTLNLVLNKKMEMRYGENPHQSAAFYSVGEFGDWLSQTTQHQGKPLSFNNVADVSAAYNCAAEFIEPSCVIVKHATPCGVASAQSIEKAYQLAWETDPMSAFGGVIAFNRPIDAKTAGQIVANQFVEVITAPGVSEQALSEFKTKENIRVLVHEQRCRKPTGLLLDSAAGGVLVQSSDSLLLAGDEPQVVTKRQPKGDESSDLLFAWAVAKHVKSNAIVYVKNQATIGIGAGQMSRIDAAKIARWKAKDSEHSLDGAVMASDAFFPFRDSIDTAAKAGISAVIQPGGSVRDDEVVVAADEHNMAMLFTGMRHFRH